MRAWTLGSGSRGNAILLESEDTRVLIDAGYSPRELARRLGILEIAPESIAAVVVTHEHVDHARGVAGAQARWQWHVFGSGGTLDGIPGLDTARCSVVAPGTSWSVGALAFEPLCVTHDAAAPTAVRATARRSGFRTGVAHDLGAASSTLRDAFTGLDLLMLESNHDEAMLRGGPYPPFLQARIASQSGHLSNRQSSAFVREVIGPSLKQLVLLHLSEVNNTPRHATDAAQSVIRGTRSRCAASAAPQGSVAGPFGCADRGAAQLSFSL